MMTTWMTKRLEEVCDVARGGSPRPIEKFLTNEPDGFNWIKIGDAPIGQKYITSTREKIKREGLSKTRYVKEGDFLLSNSMSFGRPYILKTSGCIHDGWLVLSLKGDVINQDYLYYFLSSNTAYTQFDRLASGAIVRNLNTELVRKVTISYPPVAEQKRIVAILDEAFEGIARATTNAERSRARARDLLAVIRAKTFSSLTMEWPSATLGDLCKFENGDRGANYPGKQHRVVEGIPFINAGHLSETGIDFSEMDYISTERFALLGNGKIKPNDVLFCLRGSLGKFACVGDLNAGAIASSLVIIRPCERLTLPYLMEYLASPICAAMIDKYKGGAAQPNLGAKDLKKFEIPLPTEEVQRVTSEQLASLAAYTRELEGVYGHKVANCDELRQALLRKAFSGRLTNKGAIAA